MKQSKPILHGRDHGPGGADTIPSPGVTSGWVLAADGSGGLVWTAPPAGVTYGTPAVALGTAAAAGSTDEAIRRDSTIVAFDATVPTTQAFGDAAAAGSVAKAARRDHKHAMPATPVTSIAKSGSSAITGAATLSAGIGIALTQASSDISISSPTTGAGLFPAFASGYWYGPQWTSFGTATTSINVMGAMPFWVPSTTAFSKIGVLTTGNTSNSVRLGVYADSNGYPGALLADSGQFSISGTGVREASTTITLTLTAGIYWLAHVNQVGTNTLQGANLANGGSPLAFVTDQTLTNLSGANNEGYIPRSSNTVSGALSNPFGTRGTWWNTASVTAVFLLVA